MSKEKSLDSIIKAEERAAHIRAESERIEREQARAAEQQREYQEKQKAEARRVEAEDLDKVAKKIELFEDIETRDQLLEQIWVMRGDVPTPPAPVFHRTELMQRELTAEQEAGRAAVAKAAAEFERNREIRQRAEAEQLQREGEMVSVHHPNPSQLEVFPTSGGTLGKKP